MERATSMPPEAVVTHREDAMLRSNSLRRALRVAFVASALVACISLLLSAGGLPTDRRQAGPVDLDEPTFGSSNLTPFPNKAEPSTDDLIAIMRGHGTGDVNADQALLFAGGAGGKIQRSVGEGDWDARQHASKGARSKGSEPTFGSARKEAKGLWEAAERAYKLERAGREHARIRGDEHLDDVDDIEDDAVDDAASDVRGLTHVARKVAAGWTGKDKEHKSKPRSHAGFHARSDKAKDGYFHHRLSMDDTLANLAKIRAQHEAAMAAGKAKNAAHKPESRATNLKKIQKPALAQNPRETGAVLRASSHLATAAEAAKSSKVKMDKLHKKKHAEATDAAQSFKVKMDKLHKKERAEERAEHREAVKEATYAKAMEDKAVKAAKQAEADEARAKIEAKKEQQQLALKRQEEKRLKSVKSELAHAKIVNAGWTAADAARAAYLAKQFSRKPVEALKVYEGMASRRNSAQASTQRVPRGESSSWHPTGFIPSEEQHDDAHNPDAMPEMVAGIHAKVHGSAQDPLSAETQSLQRAVQMRQDERVEEAEREADLEKQQQLESKGRQMEQGTADVRAGERLVDQLLSEGEAETVMEKVDLFGISVAPTLLAAVTGDDDHYHHFEHGAWMSECAGSKLRLAPVAKQLLNVMEQINTQNASAWLDVEDAQRHADKAEAELRAAESVLVAVLENEDRTKAVGLLEKARKDRAQETAERKAATISAADAKLSADKESLLMQQQEALKVLSHSEEAEALAGDARRVQLNKAANEAQDAATRESRLADTRKSKADYVSGFAGAMLHSATRPWSLSAQEGVQTLLGDISSKILAIEHAEKDRRQSLAQLEVKVTERAKMQSEVDSADKDIKAVLLKEHETVKGLRAATDASRLDLTRALRTYRVNLAKSAAELHGAHQVVRRIEGLMAACNVDTATMDALEAAALVQVKPWVETSSFAVKVPQQLYKGTAPGTLPQGVMKGQARTGKTAVHLEKELQHLNSDTTFRQQTATRALQRAHEIKIGHTVYIRQRSEQAPSKATLLGEQLVRGDMVQSLSGWPLQRGARRKAKGVDLVAEQIANAEHAETVLENSEEQKLSSVASMIVSDPHDNAGRR